jgi:hypothetical protein
MARYNCAFTIEKDGNETKKFEVINCESKNKEYIIGTLQKKYPDYSIHIKYIKDSINGKPETL